MMLAQDACDARELRQLIQSEEGEGGGDDGGAGRSAALQQALTSLALVTDSAVAERELSTVRELTYTKEGRDEALQRDTMELVIGTLAAYSDSPGVALQGFSALRNLARDSGCSGSADTRPPTQLQLSATVVAQVLTSLGAHGLNKSETRDACHVAEAGLAALFELVTACGAKGEADALEAGAVERVLATLAAHPGKPGVAREGLGALGLLVRSETGEAEAVRRGALRQVFSCLALIHSDARVAEAGLGALLDLTFSAEGEATALEGGGIGQVLRILERHGQDDARVAEVALGALRNLVDGEKGRDEALELEAMPRILETLTVHGGKEGDARVTEAGLSAIRNLANYDKGRTVALEQSSLAHVFIGLEAFPGDAAVVEACLGALRNLAIEIVDISEEADPRDCEDASMTEFLDLGAVEHIIRALQQHPSERGVAEAGIGALKNITDHEEGVATAMRCDALGPLLATLEAYPDDEGVRAVGLGAVSNITGGPMGMEETQTRDELEQLQED